MGVYNEPRKPASSLGRETRRSRPKDNIDLDMEDAERLGYGCHYGHFKADHPYTKDANEERLYPKKKQKTEEQQLRARKIHVKVCQECGKQFTTTNRKRIYCSDSCKQRKKRNKWSI